MSLDDTYFYYFSPKLSPREFGFPLRSLVSLINPANFLYDFFTTTLYLFLYANRKQFHKSRYRFFLHFVYKHC